MDPATLSAAVVGLIVPYLGQLAQKAGDTLTDAAAGGVVAAGKRVYESLKARITKSPYADAQLAGVEERPDSAPRQEALRASLEELLTEDPEFKAFLERMVEEVAPGTAGTTTVTDSGAVAGGDVTIRGHYAAGRDVTINGDRR